MTQDLIEMRLSELSERIRRGRELGDLTLVQLGERSGLAPSTIQKIENRQMTPSIAVIFKIAIGLGMEPADLIAAAHPSPVDIVLQRAGQHAQMKVSDELDSEKLSADIMGADLECWRLRVAPKYDVTLIRPQKLDEQIILVLEGRLEFDIDKQKYLLGAGDSLHCRAKTLYGLRNLTAKPAAYLVAGRFPHSIQTDLLSNLNHE